MQVLSTESPWELSICIIATHVVGSRCGCQQHFYHFYVYLVLPECRQGVSRIPFRSERRLQKTSLRVRQSDNSSPGSGSYRPPHGYDPSLVWSLRPATEYHAVQYGTAGQSVTGHIGCAAGRTHEVDSRCTEICMGAHSKLFFSDREKTGRH